MRYVPVRGAVARQGEVERPSGLTLLQEPIPQFSSSLTHEALHERFPLVDLVVQYMQDIQGDSEESPLHDSSGFAYSLSHGDERAIEYYNDVAPVLEELAHLDGNS